jgi:type I restriction enzyme M protein
MTRITQQQLESHLWDAAVLLRGTIDAGDYKQFIFPLLFFKRLCDVYDEETVTALRDSGGDQDFALFPENHRFQVPADAHWMEIRKVNRDVGYTLQQAMRAIEVANPDKLMGIFGDAQWTNKDRLSDATLRDLIEHFSTLELTVANLPEDELGQGYEYLIKKFADDSGHTAAEFYTNRTVVHLMTEMLDVQPGETVYDPTCGSGGMLLSCITHLRRAGKEWRNVKLYGQERNLMTSSIARMNCFLHGIEDFRIERGDTLSEPKLVEGDRLQRFDVVLANPPYSIKQWNREAFASDPWGRNLFGVPPQGRADFAFQQHILQSLKANSGRCAVLWPHGVLFRDDETAIRRNLIEADLVECVIGLGPNLFYNSAMESCIVICRTKKPKDRRGKILLIDAKHEVTRERSQSFLTDRHIARINLAYKQFRSEPGFSCIATLEDIRPRSYNLNIALYISDAPREKSLNTNMLVTANTAFRKFLESSNQLESKMATLLGSEVTPEIASESGTISLPEWFDRTKWRRVKLGDVVRQVRDKIDSASAAGISHYLPGGGISATNFKINGLKTIDDGVMGPAFHMRFMPGHVLYKSRVPHGVAVADQTAICANTTYVLESNSELLDQRLLPYLLVTDKFRQFEKDNNRGSTNLFLNFSDIARFEFDLPPLDQQRRIADILCAFDHVGVTASHNLSELTSLKQIAMQEYTFGQTDREDDKYLCRLDTVATFQYGLSCALSASGEFPILRMMNYDQELVVANDLKYANMSKVLASEFIVQEGDLLFNRTNSAELVGKVGIFNLPGTYLFASYLIRITTDRSKLLPEFLNYCLNSVKGQSAVRAFATPGVSQANISAGNLKKVFIPVPPLDQQKNAIAAIDRISAAARDGRTHLEAQRSLLRVLLNTLFTSPHDL